MRQVATAAILAAVTLSAEVAPPALKAIVEAERAFARASVEHGQRDAFLTFLHDRAITFSPGPGRGKDAIRKRPPTVATTTLNWAPMVGGASHAGDLGFTSGPYVLSDRTGAKPPRHGIYFTVWLRLPDGKYLVDLDAGVTTKTPPARVSDVTFTPLANVGNHAPEQPQPRKRVLMQTDDAYNNAIRKLGLPEATRRYYRPDARVHVEGAGALTDRAAIDQWLARQGGPFSLDGIGWRSSESRDLGYSYGSYQRQDGKMSGYYVRLWTREPRADWKVLMETFLPAPGDEGNLW